MGFFAAYSGTERVDLGRGYWIDVKVCLSQEEKARCENVLASGAAINPLNGQASAKLNTAAYREEMVSASIVAWNLDDDNDQVLPLAPDQVKRRNVRRLPGPVFDKVWAKVDELNSPLTEDEQARFPGGGERGDSDGDDPEDDTADPADLQPGEGVLAAPGPAPGGFGPPPLA